MKSPGKAWEKSSIQLNQPFQLQPSTAADPPHRKSRGKQGRDPVCSKYRMACLSAFHTKMISHLHTPFLD
jgi:hypothetical protein